MKLFDSLLGRTKPAPPNLDTLFGLPSAAVTLDVSTGLKPSGQAAVCFKPASGEAFTATTGEIADLLEFSSESSGTTVTGQDDRYGYHWVVLADPDLDDLVGAAHVVNRTLEEKGFGPQLLCSVFGFAKESDRCHLVYLYKRGTFYPFAPSGEERRNNELELQVRGALEGELPLEKDLTRWFPMWGLPIS